MAFHFRRQMLFFWKTDKATGISAQEHRITEVVVA
jgi:hypothetical protein